MAWSRDKVLGTRLDISVKCFYKLRLEEKVVATTVFCGVSCPAMRSLTFMSFNDWYLVIKLRHVWLRWAAKNMPR